MLFQLLLLISSASQIVGPAEAALEGRWRNPSGSVIIAIGPCGEAICGRVQWASEKATADARRGGTDPLVGAELLRGIEPRKGGGWSARLFVPDINKTSKAELRPLGLDRLKVTGCAVGRILCRSQIWTRTHGD